MPKQYTYPSGTTIRNLIYNSLLRQQHILGTITDRDQVMPWVLMLVARATSDLNVVDEFITYYYRPQESARTLSNFDVNLMDNMRDQFNDTIGKMIRDLLYSSHFRQTHILSLVTDQMEVPPWIVAKVSRATNDLNSVDEFLTSTYKK